MRWSDSSGAYKGGWKLSLHAVYADPELGWLHCHSNGASNARQCLNEFVKLLIARSVDVDPLWFLEQTDDDRVCRKSLIDIKAYSKNRALRCLGCRKYGSTRVLLPVENFKVVQEIDKTEIRQMQTGNWEPKRLLTISPAHALVTHDTKSVRTATLTRHWLDKVAENQCGCAIDKIKGNLITLKCLADRKCRLTGELYGRTHNRCYLILRAGKVIYRQHGVSGEVVVEEYDILREYEFYHETKKLRQKASQLGENFKREHCEQFISDVVSFIDSPGTPQFVVRVDRGRRTEFTNSDLPVPFREYTILPAGQLWNPCGPVFLTYSETTDKTGTVVLTVAGDPEMKCAKTNLGALCSEMASMNRLRTYNDVTWSPFPQKNGPTSALMFSIRLAGFHSHLSNRNPPHRLGNTQYTNSCEAS